MKLDIDFNAKAQMALLKFSINEFTNPRDYSVATSIISTFSADYDLDPELEEEDFNNIMATAKEKEVEHFIFEISEEGIEVSF